MSLEARQRRKAASRERDATIRADRAGFKGASPLPNGLCERCVDRPARKNFSICMQCSVCAQCGKNKPEIGTSTCRACRLKRTAQQNARNKHPIKKEKIAAYRQRPEVKSRNNERRRKHRSDPKYMAKELAYNRLLRRTNYAKEREVTRARRVCARLGCTKLLVGKQSTAIYCSAKCQQKAGYARRKGE